MQCLLHFAALLCPFFPLLFDHCRILRYSFGARLYRKGEGVLYNFDLISFIPHGVPPVPSGPPRKVEVEAVNSSSIKVIWRSPVPTKQHGQIRGYQVHYVKMVNGESTGQPVIKDILIDDAQVQHPPSASRLIPQTNSLTLYFSPSHFYTGNSNVSLIWKLAQMS